MDRGLLGWGIFLIVLGAIPLAVSQGALAREVASRAWQLWPLFLVAGGLGLLLKRTPLEWLSGLLASATAGAILGGLLAAGATFAWPFSSGGCALGDEQDLQPFPTVAGTFGDRAEVRIDLPCGELTMRTAPGRAFTVAGTDEGGEGPDVEVTADGAAVTGVEGGFLGGRRSSWDVTLPTDPALVLDVRVNAGSGRLSLPGARLSAFALSVNAGDVVADLREASADGPLRLEVSVNAASASLTLPRSAVQGELDANAGTLEVCVPDDVAIRIETDENLTAGYDFGRSGLVQRDDVWESPGFAEASTRIELTASANAGSIVLDPADGCDAPA